MGYQYWKYDQLEALCNDAFQKFGFTAEEAKIVSDVLLMSDRIGIESHGMQRMYRYYKSIQKGMIHLENKGGICHGFMAIDPKIFGDAEAIKNHMSQYLETLRNSPKADG